MKRKNKNNTLSDFEATYAELVDHISGRIMGAESFSEVKEPLYMLKDLADKGLNHALAMYGLAYLMEDKEWYDRKKGMEALTKAADAGEPFAQHMLGSILYSGLKGIPRDPIMAKFWIEQSASHGYPPAVEDKEKLWG